MTPVTRKDVFYSDMLVRFSHCDPAGIIFYPHYFVMFNGLIEDWFNHALKIDYANFITTRRMGVPTARRMTSAFLEAAPRSSESLAARSSRRLWR